MQYIIQISCNLPYQPEVLGVNGLFLGFFDFDECSPGHVINMSIDVTFARLFIDLGLF
jgi:hypothetical protein